MADLTLNIRIPGNATLENTVIPGDYLVGQVISELIEELNLPHVTTEGHELEYHLFSLTHQLELDRVKNLIASGVQNGDTIELVQRASDLIINIRTPGDMVFENVVTPADYLIKQIIMELLDELNLPDETKDSKAAGYHFFSLSRQSALLRDQSLVASGVHNGDTLALIDGDGFVEVILSILDINKSEQIVLELDREIGDIIRQIVHTYELPVRDKLGRLVLYQLRSKCHGNSLDRSKTLRQESIPHLDRLILTREELAGGGPFVFASALTGPISPLGDSDVINCSVFAPRSIPQNGSCLVQVFAHLLPHAIIVKEMAEEFDEHTLRRGSKNLDMIIERGSMLTFQLSIPGLEVDDPIQRLVWNGAPESVQFGLKAPSDQWVGDFIGTIRISYDQIPVGHIKFKIEVVNSKQLAKENNLTGEACIYRKAFVSYASEDRVEVLKRIQMLARLRIEVFQDILKLDPGQRWERVLYLHIGKCDLFLLFWSSSAKKSEWVIKEVRYALWLKKGDDLAPPEIIPVVIEGPPLVPPPEELAHLHFNDQFLYFIAGS